MTKKVAKKKVAKKVVNKATEPQVRGLIDEPQTARQVLDIIDKFLVGDFMNEARKLWDILAALRGPDDAKIGDKNGTTCPIRCAALPLTAKRYQTGYSIPGGAMFSDRLYTGPREYAFDAHFHNHVVSAAMALNLY